MNPRLLACSFILVCFLPFPSLAQAPVSTAAELIIAEDNVTHATIVVSPEAGRWEKQAATDLVKYIARITGANVPLAATAETVEAALKSSAPTILVGQV